MNDVPENNEEELSPIQRGDIVRRRNWTFRVISVGSHNVCYATIISGRPFDYLQCTHEQWRNRTFP